MSQKEPAPLIHQRKRIAQRFTCPHKLAPVDMFLTAFLRTGAGMN